MSDYHCQRYRKSPPWTTGPAPTGCAALCEGFRNCGLWRVAGGRVRLGAALAEGFGEGAAQLLVVGLPFADALRGKLEPAQPTAANTDPKRYSLSGTR